MNKLEMLQVLAALDKPSNTILGNLRKLESAQEALDNLPRCGMGTGKCKCGRKISENKNNCLACKESEAYASNQKHSKI